MEQEGDRSEDQLVAREGIAFSLNGSFQKCIYRIKLMSHKKIIRGSAA